jgi:hypothetical protein
VDDGKRLSDRAGRPAPIHEASTPYIVGGNGVGEAIEFFQVPDSLHVD